MGKTKENTKPNPIDDENLRVDFDINNLKPKDLIKKLQELRTTKDKIRVDLRKRDKELELFKIIEEILTKIKVEMENSGEELKTTDKWISSQKKILEEAVTTANNLFLLGNDKNKLVSKINNIIEKLNAIQKSNDEIKKENSLLTKTINGINSLFKKKTVADQPPTEEEKPLPEEPIVIQNESPEKPITQENKINNLQDVKNEIISFTKQLLDNNSEKVLNNFSKSSLEGLVKEFTNEKPEDVGVVRRALNKLDTAINGLKKNGKLVATNINTLKGILNTLEGPVTKPKPTHTNTPKKEEVQITEPEATPIKSDEEVVSESQSTLEEPVTEPVVTPEETNKEVTAETDAPKEASKQENVKTEQGISEPVSTETPAEQSVDVGPKETEINAPSETKEEISENQKLIESAKSLDELIQIIENNKISITRSNGTKENTKYLVKLINDIKKDITFFEYEATKRLFTRTDGLRDKVQNLINQEKTGQSENQELNEESKNTEESQNNEVGATPNPVPKQEALNNKEKTEVGPEFTVEISEEQLEELRKFQFESSLYKKEKLECDPIYKFFKENTDLTDEQIMDFNVNLKIVDQEENEIGVFGNYHDFYVNSKKIDLNNCRVDVYASNLWSDNENNYLHDKPELNIGLYQVLDQIKKLQINDEYQEKVDNNKLSTKNVFSTNIYDQAKNKYYESVLNFLDQECKKYQENNSLEDVKTFSLEKLNKELALLEKEKEDLLSKLKDRSITPIETQRLVTLHQKQDDYNKIINYIINENRVQQEKEESERNEWIKNHDLTRKKTDTEITFLKTFNLSSFGDIFTDTKDLKNFLHLNSIDRGIILESVAREIRHSAKAHGLEKYNIEKKEKIGDSGFFKKMIKNIGYSFSEEKKRFDHEKDFLKTLDKKELGEGISILVGTLNIFNEDDKNTTGTKRQIIDEYIKFLEKNTSVGFDKNSLATINGILNNKYESFAKAINDRLFRTFTSKGVGVSAGLLLVGSLGIAAMPAMLIGGGIVGGVMGGIRATKKRREEALLKRGQEDEKANEVQGNESFSEIIKKGKFITYNKLMDKFTDKNQIEQVEAILKGNLIIWSEKNAIKEKNDLIILIVTKKFEALGEDLKKGDNKESVNKIRTWANRYGLKIDGKLGWSLAISAGAGFAIGGAGRLLHDVLFSPKGTEVELDRENQPTPVKINDTANNKTAPLETKATDTAKTTKITEEEMKRDAAKKTADDNLEKQNKKTQPKPVEKKPEISEQPKPKPKTPPTTQRAPLPNKPEGSNGVDEQEKTIETEDLKKEPIIVTTEEIKPISIPKNTTDAQLTEYKTDLEEVPEQQLDEEIIPPTNNTEAMSDAQRIEFEATSEEVPSGSKVEDVIKPSEIVTQTKTSLDEYFTDKSSENYGFKINLDKNGNPEITRDGYKGYYTLDNKGMTYHGMPDNLDMLLPKGKNPLEESNWQPLNPVTAEPIQSEATLNNDLINKNSKPIDLETNSKTTNTPITQQEQILNESKTALDNFIGKDSKEAGFKVAPLYSDKLLNTSNEAIITREGYGGYYIIKDNNMVHFDDMGREIELLPKGKNPLEGSDWQQLNVKNTEPIQSETVSNNISEPVNLKTNAESVENPITPQEQILNESKSALDKFLGDNSTKYDFTIKPVYNDAFLTTFNEAIITRKGYSGYYEFKDGQLIYKEPGLPDQTLTKEDIVKNNVINEELPTTSKHFNHDITDNMSPEQINRLEVITKNIYGERIRFELSNNNRIETFFDKWDGQVPQINHNLKILSDKAVYQDKHEADLIYREIVLYKNLQQENLTNTPFFQTLEKILRTTVKSSKTTIEGVDIVENKGSKESPYWTAIKNAKLSDIVKDIKK